MLSGIRVPRFSCTSPSTDKESDISPKWIDYFQWEIVSGNHYLGPRYADYFCIKLCFSAFQRTEQGKLLDIDVRKTDRWWLIDDR